MGFLGFFVDYYLYNLVLQSITVAVRFVMVALLMGLGMETIIPDRQDEMYDMCVLMLFMYLKYKNMF